MTRSAVDDADVQGIVRFGYRRMTEATYALARIKNVEAARAWLRSAPITSAITRTIPRLPPRCRSRSRLPGLKRLERRRRSSRASPRSFSRE